MEFPVVPDDDFLTSQQACDQLGVSHMRLNQLIQAGNVRMVSNHARKRGFSQADIEAVLASGIDLGPAGPSSAKGMFRKARRRLAEFGLEGFFNSLGGN